MFKKVKAYMEEYQMVNENDTIVAGVSGGADSVCLFLLLEEYCKQKNAKLVAVHLNHKIMKKRGKMPNMSKNYAQNSGCPFICLKKMWKLMQSKTESERRKPEEPPDTGSLNRCSRNTEDMAKLRLPITKGT